MAATLEAPSLTSPPAIDPLHHALFLDLDGTLVEIADHPDQVAMSDEVRGTLRELSHAMHGAIALITGRTIASADSVLDGVLDNIAGVHGFEQRTPKGMVQLQNHVGQVAAALEDATALVSRGELEADVEDKLSAIALHYRRAPEAAENVRRVGTELAARHGLSLMEGKMVVELKPAARSKADALAAFMTDPPFAGRVPVAVGDDITDEDAFRAAREAGGIAILVGPARKTAAQHRLADTAAVVAWLKHAVAS